jgi:hypothetical protein
MAKERAEEERRQKEEEEMSKYEAAMELKRTEHAAKQAGMTVSRVFSCAYHSTFIAHTLYSLSRALVTLRALQVEEYLKHKELEKRLADIRAAQEKEAQEKEAQEKEAVQEKEAAEEGAAEDGTGSDSRLPSRPVSPPLIAPEQQVFTAVMETEGGAYSVEDVCASVQERHQKLKLVFTQHLGFEWNVSVTAIVAESLEDTSHEARLHKREAQEAQDAEAAANAEPVAHAAPAADVGVDIDSVPSEWCCSRRATYGGIGKCEYVGCIHHLSDALNIAPEKMRNIALAVVKACVQGGCGKVHYGACLDTIKCDKCKRGELWKCPYPRQRACVECKPGADAFSTTIEAVSSAVVKLAKCSPRPPFGILFRGIERLALPMKNLTEFRSNELTEFSQIATQTTMEVRDGKLAVSADVLKDFVEKGFSSATTNKAVALSYSGATKDKSSDGGSWVLEIETEDGVADLKWVSQWPFEDENLLPPFGSFDIKGMRREQNINFLRVGFKSNSKAETFEEVRMRRQAMLFSFVNELQQDANQFLKNCQEIDMCTIEIMCNKMKTEIMKEARIDCSGGGQDLADHFNVPARLQSAMDKLVASWTVIMAHAASRLLESSKLLFVEFSESDIWKNQRDTEAELGQVLGEIENNLKKSKSSMPWELLRYLELRKKDLVEQVWLHNNKIDNMRQKIGGLLTRVLHILERIEITGDMKHEQEFGVEPRRTSRQRINEMRQEVYNIRIKMAMERADSQEVTFFLCCFYFHRRFYCLTKKSILSKKKSISTKRLNNPAPIPGYRTERAQRN